MKEIKIQSSSDALQAIAAVHAWTRTKLPTKQSQPWNGHSPEQCMIINVQSDLTGAAYNLNRYEGILKSMAGEKPEQVPAPEKQTDDDNPLL